jgi:hypothetical protein
MKRVVFWAWLQTLEEEKKGVFWPTLLFLLQFFSGDGRRGGGGVIFCSY